jgi:hypothetical protein
MIMSDVFRGGEEGGAAKTKKPAGRRAFVCLVEKSPPGSLSPSYGRAAWFGEGQRHHEPEKALRASKDKLVIPAGW